MQIRHFVLAAHALIALCAFGGIAGGVLAVLSGAACVLAAFAEQTLTITEPLVELDGTIMRACFARTNRAGEVPCR